MIWLCLYLIVGLFIAVGAAAHDPSGWNAEYPATIQKVEYFMWTIPLWLPGIVLGACLIVHDARKEARRGTHCNE